MSNCVDGADGRAAEIIVVDNASSDGSLDIVLRNFVESEWIALINADAFSELH